MRVLIVLLLLGTLSCSEDSPNPSPQRSTISFWHMWSEPHQSEIIDSLVEVFENVHGVEVEVTLLSWANAKQKIDLAINSRVAPDVFHSSIDWIHEYRYARVIAPAFCKNVDTLLPAVVAACGDTTGQLYAYPWTLNTRTFVAQMDLLEDVNTWTQFILQAKSFGLPTYEQYNVSKKVLPVIWAFDREFLSELPFSSTVSEQTVAAFDKLRELSKQATIKPSRELDVDLLNGEIDATITGAWIVEMAQARKPAVELHFDKGLLPNAVHSNSPPSLLGGDCLAISRSEFASNEKHESDVARELAEFLTLRATVEELTLRLPEAGSPATIPSNMSNLGGFEKQLTNTRTIAWSRNYVNILETVEKAIVSVYLSDTPINQITAKLKYDLAKLES